MGGTPIDPASAGGASEKPLRLVVLLDASGSMSMYTAVFLRFIHGVLDNFREAEAFVFHTRLAYVSAAMKEKNAARALERLSLMAQGVGGGTRIGECLADLQPLACRAGDSFAHLRDDPVRRLRHRRRRVLGRGNGGLRRRCRRIVWLNPMMGVGRLPPEAAGMRRRCPMSISMRRPIRWRASPRSSPTWRSSRLSGEDCTASPVDARSSPLTPEGSLHARTLGPAVEAIWSR